MPKLKRTYEAYKDQNFQIIGISLDRSKQPLEAYVEKEGLEWIHYWDESRKLRTLYGVWGIPSAFLIDSEGIIRKASLGGFDVESAVAELMKENLAKPVDAPIRTPSDSPDGAQNVEPDAKEIINAAIAAHGGLENLETVKSIVMESESFEHLPDGTMQDEGPAPQKHILMPTGVRSDWGIHAQKDNHLIFDGESVFMIAAGERSNLFPLEETESYINFFKDSLFREPMWLLATLSKNDVPVQYIGTEKVKGESTSVLLVTQPSGKRVKNLH